jgi:hypothetical protein
VFACVTFRLLIASDTGGKSDHGGLLADFKEWREFAPKDFGRTLSNTTLVKREGGRVALHLVTCKGDYVIAKGENVRIYFHFLLELS